MSLQCSRLLLKKKSVCVFLMLKEINVLEETSLSFTLSLALSLWYCLLNSHMFLTSKFILFFVFNIEQKQTKFEVRTLLDSYMGVRAGVAKQKLPE